MTLNIPQSELVQAAREMKTRKAGGYPKVFLAINEFGGLQVFHKRTHFRNGLLLLELSNQGVQYPTSLLARKDMVIIENVLGNLIVPVEKPKNDSIFRSKR